MHVYVCMYMHACIRRPEVNVRSLLLLLSTLFLEICFLSELGYAGRLASLGHPPVCSPLALAITY